MTSYLFIHTVHKQSFRCFCVLKVEVVALGAQTEVAVHAVVPFLACLMKGFIVPLFIAALPKVRLSIFIKGLVLKDMAIGAFHVLNIFFSNFIQFNSQDFGSIMNDLSDRGIVVSQVMRIDLLYFEDILIEGLQVLWSFDVDVDVPSIF